MKDGEERSLTSDDDEASLHARLSLISALGPGFREFGEFLWVAGYMIGGDRVAGRSPFGYGNDAVVGLSIITATAGELCSGTALLLEHRNEYGAAALIRQLVEVEYLAWAFAEDEQEAAQWLRSTREQRLQQWQPRHMRQRSAGRFRGSDYGLHCDIGGHPTQEGARLLPGHTPLPDWLGPLELAIHGASTWGYVHAAATRLGYVQAARLERFELLGSAVAAWRQIDRLCGCLHDLGHSEDGQFE